MAPATGTNFWIRMRGFLLVGMRTGDRLYQPPVIRAGIKSSARSATAKELAAAELKIDLRTNPSCIDRKRAVPLRSSQARVQTAINGTSDDNLTGVRLSDLTQIPPCRVDKSFQPACATDAVVLDVMAPCSTTSNRRSIQPPEPSTRMRRSEAGRSNNTSLQASSQICSLSLRRVGENLPRTP